MIAGAAQIARGPRVVPVVAIGLLAACGESEAPDDKLAAIHAPRIAEIVSAKEALSGAHVPELDPRTMNDAEVRQLLGPGPYCAFRYTGDGKAVLALRWTGDGGQARGGVKLNGHLVALTGGLADNRLTLKAENIRLALASDGPLAVEPHGAKEREEANLLFEVRDELKIGYGGYYGCYRESLSSAGAPARSE